MLLRPKFKYCLVLSLLALMSLSATISYASDTAHLRQITYHTIDHRAQMVLHFDKPFTFKTKQPSAKQLHIIFPATNRKRLAKSQYHHHGPLLPDVAVQQHNQAIHLHIQAKHPFSPHYKSTQSNNLIINFGHHRHHAQKQSQTQPAMIVIDPGHGGKDPGATGPKGIHEKNVVLAISQAIQKDLDHHPTVKPHLTRNSDHFVTLRGRLRIARKYHANVFAAIHADAFYQSSAHGASVYALSQHGATSEAARWLAHSENYAVLGGAHFKGHNHQLQSLLLNLSQKATIASSVKLGQQVLHQLAHTTDLHGHQVEQAPFVVLKSPDIPSILIETGFISNKHEEKRLNSSSYQHKIAHAIAHGILHYLYQHPPHNSLIARQQRGQLKAHVHKGESLSSIAQNYLTTVHKLRKLNPQLSSTLQPGQTLSIPPASIGH